MKTFLKWAWAVAVWAFILFAPPFLIWVVYDLMRLGYL